MPSQRARAPAARIAARRHRPGLGSRTCCWSSSSCSGAISRCRPSSTRFSIPIPLARPRRTSHDRYKFNWLSASGTACLFAAILAPSCAACRLRQFGSVLGHTAQQLALAELTLAAVLALAFLMNYSGATATLGLAFAATGAMFPFFSALLGWLGVFLTGSDTSANALFGTCRWSRPTSSA